MSQFSDLFRCNVSISIAKLQYRFVYRGFIMNGKKNGFLNLKFHTSLFGVVLNCGIKPAFTSLKQYLKLDKTWFQPYLHFISQLYCNIKLFCMYNYSCKIKNVIIFFLIVVSINNNALTIQLNIIEKLFLNLFNWIIFNSVSIMDTSWVKVMKDYISDTIIVKKLISKNRYINKKLKAFVINEYEQRYQNVKVLRWIRCDRLIGV